MHENKIIQIAFVIVMCKIYLQTTCLAVACVTLLVFDISVLVLLFF